ncbi:MAG: c-type cytochrome domain-containing protein [Verrucomicrobiota bacterium JB023]|nr:c-type cytochrome domain-containing protein [Verrucomicrobiota bacterium JB023]
MSLSLLRKPLAGCTILFAVPLVAEEKITYEDHIYPLFEQSCLNCHNPDKKKGDLDLSSYPALLQGGSGGLVATPGDGSSSKLFLVTTGSAEPVMPPEGDKIGKDAANLIRAWIDGGLLETKNSSARKVEKPKFTLQITPTTGKPEGPPPMPAGLSLDPSFVASRPGLIPAMAAAPWSPLLAVAGQKQVLFYHTESLRFLGSLPFPKGQPETLCFDPSGRFLIAGGGIAGKSGQAVVWDITTGAELFTAGREFDSVLASALSPDLSRVALGGPSRLLKIWDTRENQQLASIKKHTDWITTLSWSPDGKFIASGDRNGGIHIWDRDGNEIHALREHQGAISGLSFRSDSQLLASASEDGNLIIWDIQKGESIKRITAHGPGVTSLHYATNGHLMTSGRNQTLKILKPDFSNLRDIKGLTELATAVSISHDQGRFFAAGFDGTITVYDKKGKEVATLDSNPPLLADRLQALEERLTRQEDHVGQAEAVHAKAKSQLNALEQRLTRIQNAHEANKARLADFTKSLAQAEAKLKAASEQLGALKPSLQQLTSNIRQGQEKLAKLSPPDEADEKSTTAINRLKSDLQEWEDELIEVKKQRDLQLARKMNAESSREVIGSRAHELKGLLKQNRTELAKLEKERPALRKALEEPASKLREAADAASKLREEIAYWESRQLAELERQQQVDRKRFQELAGEEASPETQEELLNLSQRIDERAALLSRLRK